jgi:hypothetical protein
MPFEYNHLLDETFTMAPSASQWSDPDLPHQFTTKSGVMAKFSWREVITLTPFPLSYFHPQDISNHATTRP